MKRRLIIHPHWPPSNTVGVHWVRLITGITSLDEAIVLTIDERDLEEDLVRNVAIDDTVEVVKVRHPS